MIFVNDVGSAHRSVIFKNADVMILFGCFCFRALEGVSHFRCIVVVNNQKAPDNQLRRVGGSF